MGEAPAPKTEGDVQNPAEPDPAAKPEPSASEKQAELLSRKFASLSQKEREIQKLHAQLKKERDEFDKSKGVGPKTYDGPLELLEANGWTYDDVTQFVLGNKNPESKRTRELEARIKKFEEDTRSQQEKRAKEESERAEQAKIAEFKAGVKTQIQADPARFELINQTDSHGLVYDTMVQWYEEHKEAPDPIKIGDMVEKYLEGQMKTTLEKFKSSKKLSAFFSPGKGPDQSTEPGKVAGAESALGIKTLTNAQSQTASTQSDRELSDAELLAKATKMMSLN